MKNQSISDFVAASMDAVLNSAEHKSLFSSQYKFAEDENDAKKKSCAKCGSDTCSCGDSSMADDDNDARKKKKEESSSSSSDSSSADDQNDARKKKKEESSSSSSDSSSADDDKPTGSGAGADPYVFKPDVIKAKPPVAGDSSKADSPYKASGIGEHVKIPDVGGPSPTVAFDLAIDSLLTASAALDSVGLGRGSALTLKIASMVLEAKKKDPKVVAKEKAAKEKAAKEKAAAKAKKDTQEAKDKAAKAKAKEKADKEKAAAKAKADKEKASKSSSSSSSSKK